MSTIPERSTTVGPTLPVQVIAPLGRFLVLGPRGSWFPGFGPRRRPLRVVRALVLSLPCFRRGLLLPALLPPRGIATGLPWSLLARRLGRFRRPCRGGSVRLGVRRIVPHDLDVVAPFLGPAFLGTEDRPARAPFDLDGNLSALEGSEELADLGRLRPVALAGGEFFDQHPRLVEERFPVLRRATALLVLPHLSPPRSDCRPR